MGMMQSIWDEIRKVRRAVGSLNPYEIARHKRIPIIPTYELPPGILGMFCPVGAKGVIYIQPNMPYEQEMFVLYHELFHLLLKHRGPSLTSIEDMYNPNWVTLSKQEREAHMGATSIILCQYEISNDMSYIDIARETGCPEKIVEQWIILQQEYIASKKRHNPARSKSRVLF
ncbi:ImmA/IrrE family metallo-endopeptidase [Aneurinibacillus thermoaerophilus]|uniref:ImmA/IrrE family metallo-endopeptidase n=1 Tax=Aneurinibacillus thermoaerophilus TaxID=143495 RepID=UPI002E2118B5|nr:ImmA/IrrE family metallo-endopeptidase [Aneurinibacillus thermoaerophilus]MED0736724.1 ImmA/IrrE family metallo-endopeptidase [Aneurinibacillus thermoaerophilus]